MALMADCGTDIKPWADGPTVRALRLELVRAEFSKGYYADGDTPRKVRDAKSAALRRAVNAAVERVVVTVRELGDEHFVWLASTAGASP